MNVLVNALNLRPRLVDGATTFTLNMLRALSAERPQWRFSAIVPAGETRIATAAEEANVIPVRAGSGLRRAVVESLLLGRIIRVVEPDVFVAPYESLPFRLRVPVVVVAQNLVYHGMEARSLGLRVRARYYRARMPAAYRRADRIVAVSTHAARVLHAEAGLDLGRTLVSLEGSDSYLLPPPSPSAIPREPVLLVVGAVAPHKNIESTLRLTVALRAARPELRLVLAGPETAGFGRTLRKLTQELGLSDSVTYLGPVSPSRLAELYSTSTALLHLSHVEAFGLPPLEAMRYGLPVIVANRASLPEVVGDAGLVIDPDDPGSVDLVRSVLASPERADDLRRRGFERAAELIWARAAERMALAIEVAASAFRR